MKKAVTPFKFRMNGVSFLVTFLISMFFGFNVQSQTCSISVTSPSNITVCDNPETITINITNTGSTAMQNVLINLTFPTGIQYSQGSISESTSYNIHEVNISNLSSIVLGSDPLPVDSTMTFSIDMEAKMAAIDYVQGGNILRNDVSVTFTGGSGSQTSSAYDLYYGVLPVTSISPSSYSIYSQETYTRTITVMNSGNGRVSSFKIHDSHDAGIEILSVDKGTLDGTGSEISFSSSDFSSGGNGDSYFDQNESITVTETIKAAGCTSGTVGSVIQTVWGCDSDRYSDEYHAYTSISLATPSISISTTEELSSCFGSGDASTQTITLTNNGQGKAVNLQLDIYKSTGSGYEQYIFSRIDPDNITYSIDGGASAYITPSQTYTTVNSGDYSCLGSNPIGKVTLDLPDLEAGSSITITFDMYHCNIDVSEGDLVKGWKCDIGYEDVCGNNSYSDSKVGQNENNTYMTMFNEIPTDISNGETKEFDFTINTINNDLPHGSGDRYKVVFTLPGGLSYSNLEFYNNVEWTANSLEYNSSTNVVTAIYELPVPSKFDLTKAMFKLDLTGDCSMPGASSGNVSVVMDFYYIPDTTCMNEVPFVTDETVNTTLHCGVTGCEGMNFYQFDLARTSLGQPDNDLDGLPDASGSLDYDKIKLNRVMFGDTLQCKFYGVVNTSQSNPSWSYAYATSEVENGENLGNIYASVRIYDASSSSYLTCDNVGCTTSGSGSMRTFTYDISPSVLASSCSGFSGFTYGDGDSVTLTVRYKITGNIGSDIQVNTMDNDFYVSNLANPSSGDRYSCDTYDGNFTLIGTYFRNNSVSYYNVTSCEQTVSQNFYCSIGNCCTNYSGGNIFPSEYRNWAHIKKAIVHIPMYYEVQDAYVKYVRTKRTGATATNWVYNLTPESVNGTYYTYNLEQYYEEFGGSVPYSDDGFKGRLYLTLAPTNDALHDTYQDIEWEFQFAQTDYLGGGTSDWITANPDRIKFSPSALSVSSDSPTVDGIDKTVTWDLKITNTSSSSDADNAWIHFNNPSGDITVLYLIDDDSGDTLSLTSDIYEIGFIDNSSTRDFSVVASYSGCSEDYVTAYAGYQCSGYPDSFGNFNGDVYSTGLFVDPKSASWQAAIEGQMVGDACGHSCEVYLTLTNVMFATIDSIDITLTPVGGSMTYQAGTSEILYPSSASYTSTSDPVTSGSNYVYHLYDLDNTIKEYGLRGISHSGYNSVKLHFSMTLENNFENGDYLLVSYSGKEVCGQALTSISSAYDPSVGFESVSGSGLTSDAINSWSASWADYDNDGYEDLFVTTYDTDDHNYLYHNNGDGTFTKVTSGDIVTDEASSLAAAWADYDNDGYIDLFVANNVGSKNFLYHNNGDGTFTKITNSPVVNNGIYCHSASWADYDNDGYVDLFVAEYFPTKYNHLYHNNGDGTFTAVEGNPVVTDAGHSIGAAWGDYNNDGLIDLFVPNTDGDRNYLYKNIGNGQFVKVDEDVLSTPSKSVGCSWGDYNNDGYLDMFIANAGDQDNFLYRNNGDGTFTAVTTGDIVNDGGNSHGSTWIDIDNDGDLDLYVTNDQDGDNFLYKNNGDGTFTKITNELTTSGGNSFGTAIADYDNDGDYDIFVANHEATSNFFFKNLKGQCANYLCMKLIGTNSNYNAIGARIRVKATINGSSVWQMRQITSQSGGGAGSENSLKVIFGMDDATTADSIIIDWPSGYRQIYTDVDVTGGSCSSYVEDNGAHITGKAYVDANENGSYDAGETLMKGVKIDLQPLGLTTYTDDNGEYSFYLNVDNYTITATASSYYTQLTPSNGNGYNVNVAQVGITYSGNDFGFKATTSQPDLYVDISTTMLRVGFTNEYTITYENNGTTTAYTDTLKFVLASGLEPVSSTLDWDERDGDTLYWYFAGIPPQESVTFYLTDSVTNSLNIGDYATCTAYIGSGTTDANYSDNTATDVNEVVGSVDPNDKLVFPVDRVSPGEYLTYKIRFQNVGNYPAENIVVLDTLSPDLDINTLTHVSSSHSAQMTIIDGHILRWEFDHINLPDSVHNEPESHGYVQFKIKPVEDLPNGRIVNNSATIIFDYYQFTPTNTTSVEVKPEFYYDGSAQLVTFPNPASDLIYVHYLAKGESSAVITLKTINGQKVFEERMPFHKGWNNAHVPVKALKNGTYILIVSTEDKVANRKIVVLR